MTKTDEAVLYLLVRRLFSETSASRQLTERLLRMYCDHGQSLTTAMAELVDEMMTEKVVHSPDVQRVLALIKDQAEGHPVIIPHEWSCLTAHQLDWTSGGFRDSEWTGRFTEEEAWILIVSSQYPRSCGRFHRTIEHAHELIVEAQRDLLRYRELEARNALNDDDVAFLDQSFIRGLPARSDATVRVFDLTLELVCQIESEGIETGLRDYGCTQCPSRFILALPGDSPARHGNMPPLVLNAEAVRGLIEEETVTCPSCGEQTVPVE